MTSWAVPSHSRCSGNSFSLHKFECLQCDRNSPRQWRVISKTQFQLRVGYYFLKHILYLEVKTVLSPQFCSICDQDVGGVLAFFAKISTSATGPRANGATVKRMILSSEKLMLIPTNIWTQMSLSLNSLEKEKCPQWNTVTWNWTGNQLPLIRIKSIHKELWC